MTGLDCACTTTLLPRSRAIHRAPKMLAIPNCQFIRRGWTTLRQGNTLLTTTEGIRLGLRGNAMTLPSRLKFGVFLAPFHDLGDNPTLSLERDLELLQLLDHLGYDEAWIGEHHSGGWEIIPSPEVF